MSFSLRAASPGVLPPTGTPLVGLPDGILVVPDPSYGGSSHPPAPVMWMTDAIAPSSRWAAVAEAFANRGFWPLVLETLHGDDERPWGHSAELDPSGSSAPSDHDPASILGSWWSCAIPEEGEDDGALEALAPYGRRFPGLTPAIAGSPPSIDLLRAVVDQLQGRLGIVGVTRPADALAVLGWQGPVNHFSDMGLLSAVLRSWEDRFGAVLVGVGFDTITLAVARPPSTIEAARAVAAEHFAACSDCIYQGSGSIEEHAEQLIGQNAWRFWWD